MKRFLTIIAVMVFGLVNHAMAQTATFTEGTHYNKISVPSRTISGGKEVAVLFWYGSAHSYKQFSTIEQLAQTLPSDVKLEYVPAQFNANWVAHAKAYYTMRALNMQDRVHNALFKAINVEKKQLKNSRQIQAFFSKHGAQKQIVAKTYSSFGVSSNLQKANRFLQQVQASSVPALVINGKYKISAQQLAINASGLKSLVAHLLGLPT